jgi:hypothetical protein
MTMRTSKLLDSAAMPTATSAADLDQLLDDTVLSTWTGRTRGWFAKARMSGNGPPFIKIGRKVLYRRRAVLEWLAECERRPTSERGAA